MRTRRGMVDGLRGMIPGGVSAKDFGAVTGMGEREAGGILDAMVRDGIGAVEDGFYYFQGGDRLRAAIGLLEAGCQADEVAQALDWRDFEGLAAQILASGGFAVIRNLMLTKPRREIDVVGIRLGVAILIDCKHWRRYSASALRSAVCRQIARTKHYVAKTHGAIAVPAIVTLYEDKVRFIDNVPIVPIFQLASFVDEFYGNLDRVKTIKTG